MHRLHLLSFMLRQCDYDVTIEVAMLCYIFVDIFYTPFYWDIPIMILLSLCIYTALHMKSSIPFQNRYLARQFSYRRKFVAQWVVLMTKIYEYTVYSLKRFFRTPTDMFESFRPFVRVCFSINWKRICIETQWRPWYFVTSFDHHPVVMLENIYFYCTCDISRTGRPKDSMLGSWSYM